MKELLALYEHSKARGVVVESRERASEILQDYPKAKVGESIVVLSKMEMDEFDIWTLILQRKSMGRITDAECVTAMRWTITGGRELGLGMVLPTRQFLRVIPHGADPRAPERVNTYALAGNDDSILCLRCGMRSHNKTDVTRLYCGKCKVVHDDLWPPSRLWWITNPEKEVPQEQGKG